MSRKLFKIEKEQRVELRNVNFKPQKHGDDRVLAVYVNLRAFSVPLERCCALFYMEDAEALRIAFWDDAGHLLAQGLDKIAAVNEFKDGYEFGIQGVEGHERVDRVCKFSVMPAGGQVCNVDVQLQVVRPSPQLETRLLRALCDESVTVELLPTRDLFEDAAQANDEPEQKSIAAG